ncbi:SDR family NAD(P)-dependent oxidoreductase [Streptomyces sp. JAC128]|uniref:SDR family NAD(P)-dependent oxidoreductase n=1 Tax=Streptomyces sp. JAC128 TaxID=3418412 RepID=UPI003D819BC7
MPSIAIVEAGPGTGLAIARTFGSRGFDVGLIARNRDRLNDLAGRLDAEGVTAAVFPADVLDHDALTQALKDAATRFGGIDVLEYSPGGSLESTPLTAPSGTSPFDVQWAMDILLYGAIAATRAVLPARHESGVGTLLYTNGAGSVDPAPMLGNLNAAQAALRNWVLGLHKELAGTGVQAAHVAIGVWVGTDGPPAVPAASAEEIAPSTGTCTRNATKPNASSPRDAAPAPVPPRHPPGTGPAPRSTSAAARSPPTCSAAAPGPPAAPRPGQVLRLLLLPHPRLLPVVMTGPTAPSTAPDQPRRSKTLTSTP